MQIDITMTTNNIFPVDVANMESFSLAACSKDDSKLWNISCGHLNIKGLKFLGDKVRFLYYRKSAPLIYVKGEYM